MADTEDRSIRIERDVISSVIISGEGNKVVIYQYQIAQPVQPGSLTVLAKIGPNPYKGLLAFDEADSDRYFGREAQIERLWHKLLELHEDGTQIRLLPILGPSGCGKSSLARAGLIPELARKPLTERKQARVAVLVPGTHPLEALAGVLARVATHDLTPVAKTREFAAELQRTSETGAYDGLRRIADMLPEIASSPLVVFVDQFEEVYSLCDNPTERHIFIENLFQAASDRAAHISVILTLRSDFLGETQRHPVLNQIVAQQGVIIPAMTQEELRRAINKPAELAGYPLDEATANLLVEETKGRAGALPLLQFALTLIWEGLSQGIEPAVTLERIGGVGGALAGEAQSIFVNLSRDEQEIARRVFLGLVQLGDGTRDMRRRVALDTLKAYKDDPKQFQRVIDRFTNPGVRLITLSSNDKNAAMAEVTHEALLDRWELLKDWLEQKRIDLPFQRRLESAAIYWNQQRRSNGLLWRSPDLDLLKSFAQRSGDDMPELQWEFLWASQKAKQLSIATTLGFLIAIIGSLAGLLLQQDQARKMIESVFLGIDDTTIILKVLPDLEKLADDWKLKVDKGEKLEVLNYYQNHEGDLHKAFAYYRNIMTTTGRLLRVDPRMDPNDKSLLMSMADRAEKSLAYLLLKYRIPQLELDLKPGKQNFGKYLKRPVTDFQEQYSKGSALRTTYEILFTISGAGADLNKDGFVADEQESSQMPCQTLQKIEELWRGATDGRCGWYSQEGHYADDKDCKELDPSRSTLYASIFGHYTDHAINRIKQCGIQPR